MSKELIERLRIFVADPVLGGVIEEATDRIEQLEAELETERCLSFRNQIAEFEAERDQLRKDVKMLRKTLLRIANRFNLGGEQCGGAGEQHTFNEATEALAATEPKP